MAAFINSVSSFFNTIADVFYSVFVGLIQMLANIPRSIHFFTEFSQILPAEILVYALAFVTMSVVFLIVGR